MNITIVEPKQKRNSFYQKAIEEYEKICETEKSPSIR